jgi:hypothetical protein
MPPLDALLDYVFAHPWLLWLVAGLFSLVLSRRSQVDAWVEMHPRLAAALKLLRALGLDPWMVIQSLSLLFRGRLPDPPPVKTTSKLPPFVVLALAGLILGSCAVAKPMPEDPSARAIYLADAVKEAVGAKEHAKRLAFEIESKADAALRVYCPQLDGLVQLLPPEQITADLLATCRAYVETERPAKLALPPEPELAPPPTRPPEPSSPATDTPDASAPLPIPPGQ